MKYVQGIHADLENKTIVVVYFCYFGDMVSISPFLEALRRAAKGSKIILVMDERFQEALAYNPHIDELIAVDRKHMGLAKTWALGKALGKEQPDYLFLLHGTTRTTILATAMKPKVWAGEVGTRLDPYLMDWPLEVERKDCHTTEKYLRILEDIGVQDTKTQGMRIYTCDAWEAAAKTSTKATASTAVTNSPASPWAAPPKKRTGPLKTTPKSPTTSLTWATAPSSSASLANSPW